MSPNASVASFTATNTTGGKIVEIRGDKLENGSLLNVYGPKLHDGIGIHVSGGEINGNVSTLLKLETPSESLYGSLVSIAAPNYKRGTIMKIDAPGLENGVALDVRGGSQLENGALVRLEVTGNNLALQLKLMRLIWQKALLLR